MAGDLTNRMAMIEGYYEQEEAARLEAMSEDEQRSFWRGLYESELATMKKRRADLHALETDLKRQIADTLGHIHLVAPQNIREQADALRSVSQQTYYGSSSARETERNVPRETFIVAVRDDLKVAPAMSTDANAP